MMELLLLDVCCERRIGYGEGLLVAVGGYGDTARGRGRDVAGGFLNYARSDLSEVGGCSRSPG